MDKKTVSDSAIFEQFISEELPDESIIEGRLIQIGNALATKVAVRHTGLICIVQGIDSLRFFDLPAAGDMLIGKAFVNRTWPDSLEVEIKILAENFRTLEEKEVLSAYFTFRAVDADRRRAEIDPIFPETAEEIQRYEQAEIRRNNRLDEIFDNELVEIQK